MKDKTEILLGIIVGCLCMTIVFLLVGDKVFTPTPAKEEPVKVETNAPSKEENNTPSKEEPKKEENTPVQEKNPSKEETPSKEPNQTPSIPSSNNNAEAMVVAYFEETSNETIGSKLKSGFVTVVDFLFYGKEIKGYTFEELTTSAKLKVLSIALKIDAQIEKIVPGYKESLSSLYQNVKAKIIEAYLNLTVKVCQNHESLCADAKEGFQNMKNSFGITWSFIKDLAGVGVEKLKEWYEVFRDGE